MITVIVFAMATAAAVEVVLGLVLLGWAAVELGTFVRRHPDGATGGLRELAVGARQLWPAASAASQPIGRRVIRWRHRQQHQQGRWVRRVGRASADHAHAAVRVRRSGSGPLRRGAGGPVMGRRRAVRVRAGR
ncbi:MULTISPECIES: hypothetical protein [unclassified Nonomuraea]|uniref:hypothetical protein n=1 Tax=unclassified Nonomuraea TaxID=2593643 RepID=UPI0033C3F68B